MHMYMYAHIHTYIYIDKPHWPPKVINPLKTHIARKILRALGDIRTTS